MYRDRVRLPSLLDKVMSAAEAADLIQDGMTVGMSGFTRAGEAKAVPRRWPCAPRNVRCVSA